MDNNETSNGQISKMSRGLTFFIAFVILLVGVWINQVCMAFKTARNHIIMGTLHFLDTPLRHFK